MTEQQALDNWLNGMTCKRHRIDSPWECLGRFMVLRHFSHTEYTDRMRGSVNCGAYQILVDLTDLGNRSHGRYKYLKKWTGRWNMAKAAEAMDIVARILREGG